MNERHPTASNSLHAKKKAYIEEVLVRTNFDKENAAKMLQISVPKLNYWIRRLQIATCIQSPDSGKGGRLLEQRRLEEG